MARLAELRAHSPQPVAKGRIEISKDSRYGCYLFPRTKAAVDRMRLLRCGKVLQITFRKEICDD